MSAPDRGWKGMQFEDLDGNRVRLEATFDGTVDEKPCAWVTLRCVTAPSPELDVWAADPCLTPSMARTLAAALIQFADEAEGGPQ